MSYKKRSVALFIPCLVDQIYPGIGIALTKILRHFEFEIYYDKRQTCCGQPAFNAGHWTESLKVAEQFVEIFKEQELIVTPSGSCTSMVRNFYPQLFKNHRLAASAALIAENLFEFSELLKHCQLTAGIKGRYAGRIGFHNSCHSYRELHIDETPQKIISQISGCELIESKGEPVCCGFGGLFSLKFETIAATMAKTRLEMFMNNKVTTIVSNDPGCIMHMRQEAKEMSYKIEILHLTEFIKKAMQL